jgi:shikimate kinase
MDKNIILTGMCGVGKSTIGVLLAKALSRNFLDTDVYIQAIEGHSLQEIIDALGIEAFCEIEEKYILAIDISNAIIATGGSVIYSPEAMRHLAENGVIIHLTLDFETIEKRVTNLYTRGVVMEKGQTLAGLYRNRQPFYKKYAQLTIDCSGKAHEQIVDEIITRLP